jgi:hypothetical protein
MKSVYNFVVKPKGERYNNTKKIGDSELILNTDIYRHEFTNREAIVISTPIVGDTDIKPGDTIIVHYNVFRRWHNIRGIEKNSRSYFDESTYLITKTECEFIVDGERLYRVLSNLITIKYEYQGNEEEYNPSWA